MWNPLKLFSGGFSRVVDSVGGAVNKVSQTFKGSQLERDNQASEKFQSVQAGYIAEFNNRENRTWWDSFCDGLNRLPRPVIVFLVIFYFCLAYANPEEFQIVNIALDTVLENMWWVVSAIIGFYFAAREFSKSRGKMSLTDEEFNNNLERVEKIRTAIAKKNLPLKPAPIELYGLESKNIPVNSDEIKWENLSIKAYKDSLNNKI